ncbi:Ubiquitin-conjugating enzyme E2 6, partial [Rhizophlyctis rosea]
MASKGAHKRLMKEYMAIRKNPPDYITAKPLDTNILEWHYVIRGPADSPYEGMCFSPKIRSWLGMITYCAVFLQAVSVSLIFYIVI